MISRYRAERNGIPPCNCYFRSFACLAPAAALAANRLLG
jgi:hypothetical protein